MALRVHKVVVVGCPRCVLTGGVKGETGNEREGVGKSCFCNRFVRPDCFSLQHSSILTEKEWRNNSVYNSDHFLYWGAATKRLPDGTRARFQVVEHTEFYDIDYKPLTSTADKRDYIERATATHFISRGKVAYRLHNEEEYAIPSSLKHNKTSRATQLFPNHEFSDGKGSTSFICLFDPTLQGDDIKIQVEFLTKLIKEILRNKCKVVLACTKCDEVSKGRIDLGANLATTVAKKPIPFIQTSAKEGINIEETFFHVISAVKSKRNFARSSGKNSPANLIPSYHDVIQSRNLDTTYSTTAFNQLLKESVVDFSTEWSDIWPLLQAHPSCVRVVEMLGIEQVRKMFCQRLMELKVQELRSSQKGPVSSKAFQSELSAAFRNHPDLGTDSVYDFVYSPSSTPVSKMTCNSTSSDAPPTPTATPTKTLPVDMVTPPPTFISSPPPPPPTSSIPTPTRSFMFSPTRTSQTLPPPMTSENMNRSMEILSVVHELPTDHDRSYHGSIRFRNRTLPPLPTQEHFSPTQEHFSPTRKLSSSESFTNSHPQLHDSTTSFNSNNGTLERQKKLHRRLSNSMDCLQANATLLEEQREDEGIDSTASPYLCPIDIRKAIELRPDKAASCKLPRQKLRATIPFDDIAVVQRSQSFRGRSSTVPAPPPVYPKRSPRPSASPSHHIPPVSPVTPPQPKSLNLRKESPLLLGMTIMSPGGGQSSLDFGNDQASIGGKRIILESSSNEQLDDTSSVTSGPFAEIDDNEPDTASVGSMNTTSSKPTPDYHQYRSKSHTPDLHSYSSATLPSRSHGQYYNQSVASLLVPLNTRPSSSRTSPEKENLYASIPADDEYLTMTAGVSLEELLSTSKQHRNTSNATAQSVIKKLKSVTRSKDSSGNDKRKSGERYVPSPKRSSKKLSSTASHKSFDGAFEKMSVRNSFAYSRPSVPSILRPLPPSPTKAMRRKTSSGGSPLKRKISGNDRDNIYESIDENEEWFRQLKLERELRLQQRMDLVWSVDPQLATQCNLIMENFLKIPQVQEHWLATVQNILPGFQPPLEASIPPFTINPEYIIGYSNKQRQDLQDEEEEEEEDSPELKDSNQEEEEEQEGEEGEETDQVDEQEGITQMTEEFNKGHRKLAMTDSVLMRMNRSLQQDSSSSSSSSLESEDEDDQQFDFDSEKETERERKGKLLLSELTHWQEGNNSDTLQNNTVPLLIQQQDYGLKVDNELLLTSLDGNETRPYVSESEQEEEEEYDNDITSESEEEDDNKESKDSEDETSVSDIIPQIVHQSGYDVVLPSDNSSKDLVKNNNSQTTPYAVQNGHLSVCQLNSLDSGISASNGD